MYCSRVADASASARRCNSASNRSPIAFSPRLWLRARQEFAQRVCEKLDLLPSPERIESIIQVAPNVPAEVLEGAVLRRSRDRLSALWQEVTARYGALEARARTKYTSLPANAWSENSSALVERHRDERITVLPMCEAQEAADAPLQ